MRSFKDICGGPLSEGKTVIDERFSLEELNNKDQKYVDDLMAELNKKKMSKKEWDVFFTKIMKDVKQISDKRE